MQVKMSFKERVLHTVLFEALAIASFVPLAMFITGHNPQLMLGVSLTMSVVAMLWNLVFNWGFDLLFGHDRLARGLRLRLGHSLLFEIGLLAVSLPLLMIILGMGFWEALMFDIAALIFFLIYTIVFNWSYDAVRDRYLRRRGMQSGTA